MEFNDASTDIKLFDDLNLTVESGSSVAIVGASGVGKTTLLYILGGLEFPSAGDVLIGDKSFLELRKDRKAFSTFRGSNIGFVFQFHQLLPEFSALENVAMPLLIQDRSKDEAYARAEKLLDRVGLSQRLSHRPGMLSGGEQQRVAVARAFMGKPGVVLADEPTGNLDQHNGDQVTSLLKEFQDEDGITLVIVTHSLELAMQMDTLLELKPDGIQKRM
ncbi:UNVERIFIED_CONTAM: hypothetical protein GTU68_059527 [Idotea baltica]|nr:hypothetical protein [Idotea baltica]